MLNSGPWILIGTAVLLIVVGGFLIRTAVKIVTHCAVVVVLLVAAVHSLLGVVKYTIEFASQLTYNLSTLPRVFLRLQLCHPFLFIELSASRSFVIFNTLRR